MVVGLRERFERLHRFDADIGAWLLTDTPVAVLQRTENENAIVAWLADHEGSTPKQVSTGAGIDYEATKKAMNRMKRRGALDYDGHGRYWLPVNGP